jgi:hypothetical protein
MGEALAVLLVPAAILGVIPSVIARRKGRDPFVWWLYGTGLFIIALPHALLLKAGEPSRAEKVLVGGARRRRDGGDSVRWRDGRSDQDAAELETLEERLEEIWAELSPERRARLARVIADLEPPRAGPERAP